MAERAQTIDEVVDELTAIIDDARRHPSRAGYFAALYRKVTVRVRERIAEGAFDDDARMERLDVLFANRYLDAVRNRREGAPITRSWEYAFTVTEQWSPIVLQHLLLGMNAHINLDLGIAAAQTVRPADLPELRSDFNRINALLAGLVGEVRGELAQIWTTFRLFNRYRGDAQTVAINFSMTKARDHAWSVAERLAPLSEAERAEAIDDVDRGVVDLAGIIRNPGLFLGAVTRIVPIGELGSIRRKIAILE